MAKATLSYFDESGNVRVFRAAGDSFTIGSDDDCDLTISGLGTAACRIYLAEGGYYAHDLGDGVAIEGRPGSGYLQNNDTLTLGGWLSLRLTLESESVPKSPPPHQAAAPSRSRSGRSLEPGAKRHRPSTAIVLGLLPGGGQAYNGQPIKGAFFLLFSALVLPWIWSLFDARVVAGRIAAAGGRTGRGGLLWFFLHSWLVMNVMLLATIVLTLVGVLQ
ncbi:MAG: hypothetical protein GY906_03080 [bacterium]|nr:hypothetical protein [bacterium]